MKKDLLYFSFLFLVILGCSTEEATPNYPSQTKNNQDRISLIAEIVSNPDFIIGFNKFLKDKPSQGKVARIEFWLDTLIDQNAANHEEIKALNLRAGTKLEFFSSTFTKKFELMDSLLQNAISNNESFTELTIEEWETDVNTTLGIDDYMLAKHSAHHEYTSNLVAIAEKEIAARNRMLALYPQLQANQFVAECIEHYYSNL